MSEPKQTIGIKAFGELMDNKVRALKMGSMNHYIKVAYICKCNECFCCKCQEEFALRLDLYDKGYYDFPPPPVGSNKWNRLEWVYYIDANGQWLYYKLEHYDLRRSWVENYDLACMGSSECLERQLSKLGHIKRLKIAKAFGLETIALKSIVSAIVTDDEVYGYEAEGG